MRKAYVVFKGERNGVYDTWAETHAQVDGYKGALYQKFSTKAEAIKAFEEYVEKQRPSAYFETCGEESSCATSNSSSRKKSTKADKIVELESTLSDLQKDVLQIVEKMREIKEMIHDIKLSDD
ncbi:hypothetical protein F511_35001 [Dorcoceras hygrometricum]|uniref:Ribonuclease H1 N-terminal domain-containing protein n=1 Tax=Dorcoceras hygrometricum TaxID=472368 RepID=A0A2Z7DCS5_9LAMI|nr:hypothetical protein F511_35001 [Dorcoceras hygrometricum]